MIDSTKEKYDQFELGSFNIMKMIARQHSLTETSRKKTHRNGNVVTRAAMVLVAGLEMSGCGTVIVSDAIKDAIEDPQYLTCVSSFYLPYAVLAADSYRTRDTLAERLALLINVPVDSTPLHEEPTPQEGTKEGIDPALYYGGVEGFTDGWPSAPTDCVHSNKKTIRVPLSAINEDQKWKRALDIEKYAAIRDWRVFVPDLAIDVWRRKAKGVSNGSLEYAIVFRGTTGAGGWFSNFRAVTALLPIFWDQYKQSYLSAQRIVEQIELTECLRNVKNFGKKSTDCLDKKVRGEVSRTEITAVGHSLGAGLAKYVFYKVPAITKVIGFNPSPIDGARTSVSIDDRQKSMQNRNPSPTDCPLPIKDSLGLDSPPVEPSMASMFFLFEKGEALTSIASCQSGPSWGDEGGPMSFCQMVNLSHGNTLRQHSMNQMACALAIHHPRHPTKLAAPAAQGSEAKP